MGVRIGGAWLGRDLGTWNRHQGEPHGKDRAFSHLGAYVQLSAVRCDDRLHDIQSQSCSRGPFLSAGSAFEPLAYDVDLLGWDPDALVAHPHQQVLVADSGAQTDHAALLRVLHGVGHQLEPGLGDSGGIDHGPDEDHRLQLPATFTQGEGLVEDQVGELGDVGVRRGDEVALGALGQQDCLLMLVDVSGLARLR